METRDTIATTERRVDARRRATEGQLASRSELARLTAREERSLDRLHQTLYVTLSAAAVTLLLSLLLAMTDVEPRWLSLGLAAVAGAVWGVAGALAPVLPFLLSAVVAHIPDRVWNPRARPD